MARYGALTSYGQFRYGAGPTNAAQMYRTLQEGVRGAFDVDEGTHVEASNYARARTIASARRYLLACFEQRYPEKATFGLEKLEHDYGLTPAPGDSDAERRQAVALARKIKRGSTREALETALGSFLGDGFVGLFYPDDGGTLQGKLGFERTDLPYRFWTLLDPVAGPGVATVRYAPLGHEDGYTIGEGDRVYVHSNALASYDAVTVTAADPVLGTFTAAFAKAHAEGTPVVTHAPFLLVGWRNVRVGLTSATLAQNKLVRKVRDFLEKTLRVVTTFQLIPGSQTPFQITAVSPPFALAGAGDALVDVAGIDLPFTGILKADGIECVTLWDSDVLVHATIPSFVTAVPGFKVLRVVDGVRLSNAWEWAVNYPVPVLLALDPAFAFFEEVDQPVDVSGSGFAPGSSGRFDAQTATYIPGDATSATLLVPYVITQVAGTKSVRMVNPLPGGGTSNPLDFEIRFRAPSIGGISSTSIFVGRDPGVMTLTCDPDPTFAFYAASVVTVNGVVVASTCPNRSTLLFSFPSSIRNVAGVKDIVVSNPTTGGGGGDSGTIQFEFVQPVLLALDITEVVQYFDGFDVTGILDNVDANFVITYNDVVQPTTPASSTTLIAHVTSAACAVPGTTLVRAKDTISGLSTNALSFTVYEWDPSRLGSTLRLWLDGSSLVNDGTGKVAQWNDKSGGARHCLPVNAGQLATLVAASPALNNRPAARFAVSPITNYIYTPWLVNPANLAQGLIQRGSYTIWVVAINTATGTGSTVLGDFYGYIYVAKTGYDVAPGTLTGLDSMETSAQPQVVYKWFPPGQTAFVLRQRKNVTTRVCAARVNRNTENVRTTGTNLATFQPSNCYVGSAAASGGSWVGDIGEVVVCDSDVNATHKAIMDNRFSYLYSLPFGTGAGKPQIGSISPTTCTQFALPFYLYANDPLGGYTLTTVINAFDTPLVTEYISPYQVRARMPNAFLAVAKGLAITVADVGGISAPTGLTIFPFVDAPGVPNLHSVEPNTAPQYGDPLFVRARGPGFTASSVLKWNGNAVTTTLDGADLTATLPAIAFDTLPGPIITVSDPSGDSPNSLEITLTPWSLLGVVGITGLWESDDVIVAAGKVTQWNDKTGNGRHFTQADTAKQAIYSASDAAFNGLPSATFDGVDDQYGGPNGGTCIGSANSTCGGIYRYTSVDGAGGPTQPFVNDVFFAAPGIGVSAHASPLTLLGFASDGSYRSVANTTLVVNATQRFLLRVTALVLSLEVNNVASPTYTLGGGYSVGASLLLGYINFGSNNAMSGKIAMFFTMNQAMSAQDAICLKNFCRVKYGTPGT